MKLNKKGFSLIELMVVIAIIGILATAGISMYGTYQAKARDTKRVSNLNSLTVGLQGYFTDKSEYPAPKSGSCFSDASGIVDDKLKSYYDNKAIPLDPLKSRTTGDCTVAASPLYKQLTKETYAKTAYILASNVEVKSSANLKYVKTIDSYENFTKGDGTSIGGLSDTDRNDKNKSKEIVYAIVQN